MNHKLNAIAGLNQIVPGPLFKGQFIDNTEAEYDALEWLDERDKPLWADVEAKALNHLRRTIAETVNQMTNEIITYGFRYSTHPDTEVWSTSEWQFDILVLVISREMFTYPYYMKASENEDTSTNYITINMADELLQFQMEFLTHVSTSLATGRGIKDSLSTLNRQQLEDFEENRTAPVHSDIW